MTIVKHFQLNLETISSHDVLELKLLRDSLRQEMQMSKTVYDHLVTIEQARVARIRYEVIDRVLKGVKEE